jgi:hypothetical protein
VTGLAGGVHHIVQYRKTDEAGWTTPLDPLAPGETSTILKDLDQNVEYEVRVSAVSSGLMSAWSSSQVVSTDKRKPQLGDLVVWDGRNEIDLTRVQMLAFTIIAATFIISTIYLDNKIPESPAGFLELLGLSNSVYLLGRYAGNRFAGGN